MGACAVLCSVREGGRVFQAAGGVGWRCENKRGGTKRWWCVERGRKGWCFFDERTHDSAGGGRGVETKHKGGNQGGGDKRRRGGGNARSLYEKGAQGTEKGGFGARKRHRHAWEERSHTHQEKGAHASTRQPCITVVAAGSSSPGRTQSHHVITSSSSSSSSSPRRRGSVVQAVEAEALVAAAGALGRRDDVHHGGRPGISVHLLEVGHQRVARVGAGALVVERLLRERVERRLCFVVVVVVVVAE